MLSAGGARLWKDTQHVSVIVSFVSDRHPRGALPIMDPQAWGSLCYLTWTKIFVDSSFHHFLSGEAPKFPLKVHLYKF